MWNVITIVILLVIIYVVWRPVVAIKEERKYTNGCGLSTFEYFEWYILAILILSVIGVILCINGIINNNLWGVYVGAIVIILVLFSITYILHGITGKWGHCKKHMAMCFLLNGVKLNPRFHESLFDVVYNVESLCRCETRVTCREGTDVDMRDSIFDNSYLHFHCSCNLPLTKITKSNIRHKV